MRRVHVQLLVRALEHILAGQRGNERPQLLPSIYMETTILTLADVTSIVLLAPEHPEPVLHHQGVRRSAAATLGGSLPPDQWRLDG